MRLLLWGECACSHPYKKRSYLAVRQVHGRKREVGHVSAPHGASQPRLLLQIAQRCQIMASHRLRKLCSGPAADTQGKATGHAV